MLDGRLSLTTPEGIRLQLAPAGAVPRAWAWLIDLCIWLAAMAALGFILGQQKAGLGVFSVILFVSYWGYPVVFEVCFGGSTPGKRAMGLVVRRADGLPVGWRESALRNLLLVADFLPMLYITGLLFMLFDAHFRRVGDLVAGTQVVYRDATPARPAAPDVPPLPLPFPLTAEQQRAISGLFERADQLPAARLEELGTIAEPLTGLRGEASLDRLRRMAAGLVR